MEEIISFKHYKPIFYNTTSIILTIMLVFSIKFLLKDIDDYPAAFGILIEILALRIALEYIIDKKIKDITGSFVFRNDNFDILAFKKQKNIDYNSIIDIRKEYYKKNSSIIIGSATQYNPGKYTIELKNNKQFSFCIADSEEKTYNHKIKKLNKEIYGINALKVHLNTKKLKNKINDKEKQFEFQKPQTNYSLDAIINKLLEKTGLKLNDLTIE